MKTIQATLLWYLVLFPAGPFLIAAPPQGTVVEWGYDSFHGSPAPPRRVASNAVAISAGMFHGLALRADGTVAEWRGNALGQPAGENTPSKGVTNGTVRIGTQIASNIVSVAAGREFSLALRKDGKVVTWGQNYVPAGLSNVVAIAAEWGYSWLLRGDGSVVGWASQPSSHEYGQLLQVEGLSNAVAIAVGPGGYNVTRRVALRRDGTVGCWGDETIHKDAAPPASLSNVVAIAAGHSHTLALKADGTVVGWGFNKTGAATGVPTKNSGDLSYYSSGQVQIGGENLSNVVAIAASSGYSLALKKDGTVVGWGRMVNDLYPVTVPEGLSNVVAIAAGESFSLAITTNSTAVLRRQ